MELIKEKLASIHQRSVEQAIGEFRSYFKALDRDSKQIIKNQRSGFEEMRSIDVELRDRLRLDYLKKKFGEKASFLEYTAEEIIEMYGYFNSLEKSFQRCYEAGLVKLNDVRIDGSLNGTATKIDS
jgi:hypothetical protein